MKQAALSIIFIFFLVRAYSQCADTANLYSFVYNDKTYEVVLEKKSWTNAAACAVERGGYLVEINSETEQLAVYNAISGGAAVPTYYVNVPDGGGIGYVWIGATDKVIEGSWIWDGDNDSVGTYFWHGDGPTGNPVGSSYYNWGGLGFGTPNEPDDYGDGQDYAAIGLTSWPAGTGNIGSTAEWNDIKGSTPLYFVIEYDSITGIKEEEPQKASLFPNPTTGKFTIEGINIQNILIYNSKGQLIIESTENEIDLSTQALGLYFVQVITHEGVSSRKILLQ